jgi:hypothetical protein
VFTSSLTALNNDVTMTRNDLDRLVKEAFCDLNYPGDDRLIAGAIPQHVLDPESEEVYKAFVGKKWGDVDREDFIYWPQAIPFFTPIAFVYYLPGILLASLGFDDESGFFTESFITRLTPDKNRESDFSQIIALLTPPQSRVIAEYLRFVTQELYGGMELGEAQIALERFWNPFL